MDYIKQMRTKVGHECLILVAGNIIISDKDNNYYFQRKHNGKLAFVGGFIEPTESVIEGTIREAKEEIDLDVESSNLALYAIYSKHTMRYPNGDIVRPHSLFFKYQIEPDVHLRAMPEETLEIVKCELSNDLEMINVQHQEVLEDLINDRKGVIVT
ncbi:NUDIX domain-containing protein [Mollicutes bacterium LVI A0078]|nr:NUDIX domain-containing protein [Mollicutes bacterium LVI A0075]WOO91220.1 NUDIX domain-containing protein [Mollicutes bacterium LVI A0078]